MALAKYRSCLVPSIGVAIFVSTLYWVNSRLGDEGARSGVAVQPPTVRVARVRYISLPRESRVRGELLPVDETEVRSRLSGKVAEVRVKAGDLVSAGTVVAVIHSSDLDERIQRLDAAVVTAHQEWQLREQQAAAAAKGFTENLELMRRDLIPRRDLEQSERTAETARAQADLARAYLAQQEAMLAQIGALQPLAQIAAPRSGAINRLLIMPGGVIAAGKAILTLVDLETLKLTARVSRDSAGILHQGTKAQISSPALPAKTSPGNVTRVGPGGEGAQDFVEVEIYVENRERLFRPGMTVEARIDLGQTREQRVVPRSAINSENQEHYVYTVADSRAWRRRVALGPEQNKDWVVVEGLETGDVVVLDRPKSLEDGSWVRLMDENAARLSGEP